MKKITAILASLMILITPTAHASAMSYMDFVQQIQTLETRIVELQSILTSQQSEASIISATDTFKVYVADTLVYSTNTIDDAEVADIACGEYAFNTLYMWEQVRCEFEEETLYDNVFVAG